MSLKIIWGDIVKEKTDALVTLASREPRVGSGVDKAVHNAAGSELLRARLDKAKQMGPGIATFTPSFGLKKTCGAKNVIHIAGVLWEGGGHDESILLDAAYLKAMAIANALGAEIVTLPVMGAGKYGMPKTLALDQAVKSLKECLRYFPDIQIKLVTVEAEIYDYAKLKYADLCESHFSAEEEEKFRKKFPMPVRDNYDEYRIPWLYSENDTDYWKRLKLRQFAKIGDFSETFRKVWKDVSQRDKKIQEDDKKRSRSSSKSSSDHNLSVITSVRSHVLLHSKTALAGISGVTVSTIKHILDQKSKSPSRDVVMALCLALELPLPYFKLMLRKCGYTFVSDMEERIIADCIKSGEQDVRELNEVLRKKLGKDAMIKIGKGDVRLDPEQDDTKCKATTASCKAK